MSKGLGKIQRVIYDLLSGDRMGLVYKNTSGLDTSELLNELLEAEFISNEMPRKQQMATVVRACGGLARRGLIGGEYVPDLNNVGRTTIRWSFATSPSSQFRNFRTEILETVTNPNHAEE